MSVNSRLEAIQITGQRKAFYRQIIPEPSCARKETVDTYILVTSKNGDRKNPATCRSSEEGTFSQKKKQLQNGPLCMYVTFCKL